MKRLGRIQRWHCHIEKHFAKWGMSWQVSHPVHWVVEKSKENVGQQSRATFDAYKRKDALLTHDWQSINQLTNQQLRLTTISQFHQFFVSSLFFYYCNEAFHQFSFDATSFVSCKQIVYILCNELKFSTIIFLILQSNFNSCNQVYIIFPLHVFSTKILENYKGNQGTHIHFISLDLEHKFGNTIISWHARTSTNRKVSLVCASELKNSRQILILQIDCHSLLLWQYIHTYTHIYRENREIEREYKTIILNYPSIIILKKKTSKSF